MPRTLWVLRHAKTVTDPPKGKTDHERPLAPRGRRDADALAQRLGEGGDLLGLASVESPALVLCSTATRTRQTAERVLGAMADPPPVDYRRSIYAASPEEVLREIGTVDDDVRSLMVVGHNPTFHILAAELARPTDRRARRFAEVGFPTTGLAIYRLPAKRWRDAALGTGTLLGLFYPPY
jgi:phosphohistidine phosphatase